MKRFTPKVVALAAAATLLLSACGGSGETTQSETPGGGSTGGGSETEAPEEIDPSEISGTVNLVWWGNDARADLYNEALALFNEDYPNISVTTSFSAFPDYWTARATEAASNTLPDVMQFDAAYLRQYANAGKLLDLNPYIDSGLIDVSGYEDSLLGAGYLNDQQVAIPTGTNTLALFLNTDVLEATGVAPLGENYTWDDLNQMLVDVANAGAQTADGYNIYGSADYTATFWFFLQWLVQNDNVPFNDDGTLNFTQDQIKEFLGLTAAQRDAGQVFPVERGVALAPKGGFTNNEAAYEISWDNFLGGYEADSGKTNIQMFPIPAGADGQKQFLRPAMHIAVANNTQNPEASALLANFLLTDERVGAIFGTNKGVPGDAGQRGAVVAEEGSIDARVLAYESSLDGIVTSEAPIPIEGFGVIEEKWRVLGEELNYKTISIDDFAQQWWDEAERVIAGATN